MPLTTRIFLVYGLFVALSGYFVLNRVYSEIKPAVRQSTEETLVDTANLLAEILSRELRNRDPACADLADALRSYGQRHPGANIWGIAKADVTHRIYVTDARGIVVLDSLDRDVGRDYSRWNDVYLTLRGQYGARSTEEIPGDETSTVMHVAAPIRAGDRIVGVVTVAKPNRSVQPFIDRSQHRLALLGSGLIFVGLALGALLSWWLSGAIRRLTGYAEAVSLGQRVAAPDLPGGELHRLSQALDSMRTQLEGKAYVERYVQTLTHELKSPLAAIQGAAELLRRDMPPAQRELFLDNIDAESLRLQNLSERLLHLALVEQRQGLEERVGISLRPLLEELVASAQGRLQKAGLAATIDSSAEMQVRGERFLIRQALANLLDNALDFTPPGGAIRCSASRSGDDVTVVVANDGEPIPEFALPRLTERFYSLPRPATGRKSTGLGLNFVQEVAQLHGGALTLANVAGGVEARLRLPAG
ncbi:MAG: two-component system sensor histidine kinase CreC [Pseudomonadota bacterium]